MKQIALALTLLAPVAASAAPGGTAAERARERDASIDRGILSSHAETIGGGNFTFNSYELFVAGFTWGISDDLQVSAAALLPIVEDTPLTFSVAPKLVLWRGDRTTLAAQLQSFFFNQDGNFGGIFSGGLAIDHYFDADGRFSVHGGLQGGVAAGATNDTGITISEGALLQLDAGFTAGLTDLVKVLVEAKMLAAYADGKFEVADAVLLNYGVRFHGKSLAADLGFLRPFVKGQDDDGPFVLGLPFVSFSYRF